MTCLTCMLYSGSSKRNIRVLQLTTSFPLYPGHVAGVFILELAKSFQNIGVQCDVVAPHAPGAKKIEDLDEIRVRRLSYFLPTSLQRLCYGAGMPANIKKSFLGKLQLPILGLIFLGYTLIQARKYDLVHAHWNLPGLAAILASNLCRIPVVINVHHGQNIDELGKIDKYIFEKADSIVCNSSFNRSQILKYCNPSSCPVISPGVDTTKFVPDEDKECQGIIGTNNLLVLSVGRLIEWKGFQYLLQAAAEVKDKIQGFQLYIAGDGPEKTKFDQFVIDNNLEDHIIFLGNVPNEEIVDYYQCADVFVLPSILDEQGNTEGLGVVLLEAMACAVPCIASNVGGIPDIVQDGHNGFLVEQKDVQGLAEKMIWLLRDSEKRREMGQHARSFVKNNYDWEIKSRQLKDLYEKIIQ